MHAKYIYIYIYTNKYNTKLISLYTCSILILCLKKLLVFGFFGEEQGNIFLKNINNNLILKLVYRIFWLT